MRGPTEVTYSVRRLTVPVAEVRAFQVSYELAVPDLPRDEMQRLVSIGAPWSEMVALVDRSAPNGFLIYRRSDLHPLMSRAGDSADCIAYLMGNHILAERMFRHDPRTMLYAPLHTVIWEDARGDAWFSVDQPSTQFASLEVPAITAVGLELDRKLASLFEVLNLEVPVALRSD